MNVSWYDIRIIPVQGLDEKSVEEINKKERIVEILLIVYEDDANTQSIGILSELCAMEKHFVVSVENRTEMWADGDRSQKCTIYSSGRSEKDYADQSILNDVDSQVLSMYSGIGIFCLSSTFLSFN